MSSANSLAFDKLSARSFMYIRGRSKGIVEPWATHALTSAKEGTCPLSTTLRFRFLKNLNKFKMLSGMSFCLKNCYRFDDLRYILFIKKNKTLSSLPPTSNVSLGDDFRSYYVVRNCSNLILAPDTYLNLLEFDWNSVDSVLMPNK